MDNSIIVVNDEPYCIWERDIKRVNKKYIDSINHEYYSYIAEVNSPQLDTGNHQLAAMAIRAAYYLGLETLFSLLGAMLQAYDCVYAWVSLCSNSKLYGLVKRINNGDKSIFTKHDEMEISWINIANIVFMNFPHDRRKELVIERFSALWGVLANELVTDNNIKEYNSLKHSLRAIPGGFAFKIKTKDGQDFLPSGCDKVNKHGCTYIRLEKVGKECKQSRSYRSKITLINWNMPQLIDLLNLISMSILNIIAALRVLNGVSPEEVQFAVPDDYSIFEKAFEKPLGVTTATIDEGFPPKTIIIFSKDELNKLLG